MLASKICLGDKCKIIAPSNTVTDKDLEELQRGIKYLETLGLECIHSKNIMEEDYIKKAEDINASFRDNSNIVVAARGGDNCEKVLKYLKYTDIKPKIFCGFSDLTSLLNDIYFNTGLITFHGCNVKTFGRIEEEKMDDKTFEDFKKKFMDNDFTYSNVLVSIQNSPNFQGRLIGGNLSCFVKLIDYNRKIDLENCILFLEELGYESKKEDIKRNLVKLKSVKGFEKVSGIIVGNYESIEDEKYKLEDIIVEEYKKYNFNVVKGDFFGHSKLNLIIPIGAKAMVENNVLIIKNKVLND